nr:hypothetical protein [uncultured Anaerotignum sp.]
MNTVEVGQKFHAVDRLGLESWWIVEDVADGMYSLRAIGITLKKCQRDIDTFKAYGKYQDSEYDSFVTTRVEQAWMDNRKITIME